MKVQIVVNGDFEEMRALINADTNEVLAIGDYYHDKIDEYIDGVLHGLDIAGVAYDLVATEVIEEDDYRFDVYFSGF